MNAPVWEKVQQLFEEASEIPSGARDAWLEGACDGDRTLYLQVQSLLLADDDEDGFLEREVASWADRIQLSGNGYSLGAGSTIAIGQVFYDVAMGTLAGPITISFLLTTATSFSDINGTPFYIQSLNSGTLTVTGTPFRSPRACSFYLLFFLCAVVFSAVLGIVLATAAHGALTPTGLPFTWVFELAGSIAAFAVEFQTGRWIARRAHDREMAACAAFLMIHAIVMPVIGEIVFGGRWVADLTKGVENAPAANTTGG